MHGYSRTRVQREERLMWIVRAVRRTAETRLR